MPLAKAVRIAGDRNRPIGEHLEVGKDWRPVGLYVLDGAAG
jgi:hypothetical protein